MAKKVTPKGLGLKPETKSEIRQSNIKRTLGNVKKYGLIGADGKVPLTTKEIIANEKVKSAFRLGKKK